MPRGKLLAGRAGMLLAIAALSAVLFGANQGRAGDGPPYVHSAALVAARADAPATPAVPPDGVSGQTVHGFDDRERITDTEAFPWSAYAYLELYQGDSLVGSCSGVFIGPDAVLTAAHCLYSDEDGWMTDIAVVPGNDGATEPFGWDWGNDWWVPDAWIETGGDDSYDWGIIRMASSDLGNSVGYLPIGVLSDETLSAPGFTPAVVGYPGDAVPEGSLWGDWADEFAIVEDFLLYYDIDTMGGQSGSPIISLGEGDHFGSIVGIHTTGGSVYNNGSRIDEELLADIDYGCFVMNCVFYYYIEEDDPFPALDYRLILPQLTRN